MGLRQDIEEAIRVHAEWKARFREFLHGKTAFDLSAVGFPNACKLGHWLEHEGRALLAPADYSEIDRLHAEFHRVSGELVQKIKQKDFAGAREDLKTDGAFDQASRAMSV